MIFGNNKNRKGNLNPMFGRKHSELAKQKMRLCKLHDNNPMWKGDKIKSITWLHRWLWGRIPKPEKCPRCNLRPPFDLMNITGIYNRDLDNWEWSCRSCHMKFDYKSRVRVVSEKHYNKKRDSNGRFLKCQ